MEELLPCPENPQREVRDCSGPLCLQVEVLLLPWNLHGLAFRQQPSELCQWSTTYLNAVPEGCQKERARVRLTGVAL